jgi:hypothetical protein
MAWSQAAERVIVLAVLFAEQVVRVQRAQDGVEVHAAVHQPAAPPAGHALAAVRW